MDDPLLRYGHLNSFDAAMNNLEGKFHWLTASREYISRKNDGDKVVVYERARLLFVFNFHHTQSFADYKIGSHYPGV